MPLHQPSCRAIVAPFAVAGAFVAALMLTGTFGAYSRSQGKQEAAGSAAPESAATALHGFYLTVDATEPPESTVIGQALLEDKGLSVQRHLAQKAQKKDEHGPSVHEAHLAMLQACVEAQVAPCLVLEGDARWAKGSLRAAVETIVAERGDAWDLIALGHNVCAAPQSPRPPQGMPRQRWTLLDRSSPPFCAGDAPAPQGGRAAAGLLSIF